MATNDEGVIRIERVSGIVAADEAEDMKSLTAALKKHAHEISDPEARLSTKPLSDAKTGRQMDALGVVSGYRPVYLDEIFKTSASDFKAFLMAKLTGTILYEFEYEAVWARGSVVVFYLSGEAKTQDL